MKISILLPYKENFTHDLAGAVSLFVSQISKKSKYNNNISIYGNTKSKNYLTPNYKNISFEKNILQSSSKNYVNSFLKIKYPNHYIQLSFSIFLHHSQLFSSHHKKILLL